MDTIIGKLAIGALGVGVLIGGLLTNAPKPNAQAIPNAIDYYNNSGSEVQSLPKIAVENPTDNVLVQEEPIDYKNLKSAMCDFYEAKRVKDPKIKTFCRDTLLLEKMKVKIADMVGTKGGQCISFIQKFMGLLDNCQKVDCYKLEFKGNAIDIKPNSDKPKIGSIVLFSDTNKGHAAIIADIIDGELVLIESNFYGDEKITYGRVIKMNDPKDTNQKNKIRGYYDFNGKPLKY